MKELNDEGGLSSTHAVSPAKNIDPKILEQIAHGRVTYRIGIIFGSMYRPSPCLSGLLLVLLGFSGKIEWFIQAKGFSTRLANASPGAFFCVDWIGSVVAVQTESH